MENGTLTPIPTPSKTVVGINFGNSYASIAVINKEGLADCIANEDGERQIACAVSYHGEEIYVGNQAKPQLVKNAENTITNFRNLLGKRFSEYDSKIAPASAPLQALSDEPGYTVQILVPAPAPPPATPSIRSNYSTPAPTRPPTPPAPIPSTKTLTVSQVSSLFLSTLRRSAEDFLGCGIDGAVIAVPSWWSEQQREALQKAAKDAGINILQLADEAGVAVLGYEGLSTAAVDPSHPDRTSLVLDLGASSLSLSLLSISHGIMHTLDSTYIPHSLGGDKIDDILISHFFKEFTKKTKIPVSSADKRSDAKLRLAVEHTKRSISASTAAASCSVESLKDGMDFSSSINRLRFDLLLSAFYGEIAGHIDSLLQRAGVEKQSIDEVLLVGGSAGLSGLAEKLEAFFGVDEDEESRVRIRGADGDGESAQVIAKGCALQAKLLASIPPNDTNLQSAFASDPLKSPALTRPIGLVFPTDEEPTSHLDLTLLLAETPLPARRIVKFSAPEEGDQLGFEVWEGQRSVRVVPKSPAEKAEDEEDDADEEERKEIVIEKHAFLTALSIPLSAPPATPKKGSKRALERWVEVKIEVNVNGAVKVASRQVDQPWVEANVAGREN